MTNSIFLVLVSLVKDIDLNRRVEDLYEILKKISVVTDRLQSANCKISDVVCTMKHLEQALQPEIDRHNDIKELVSLRLKKMLRRENLAAFVFSPTHRKGVFSNSSCKLTSAEKEIAFDYIQTKCPTLISKAWKFGENKQPFNKAAFGKLSTLSSMTDFEWWAAYIDMFPEVLSDEEKAFILQLASATASSADLERTFSKFGLIQSKLRNRLGTQLATKLVFLYNKLNQTD